MRGKHPEHQGSEEEITFRLGLHLAFLVYLQILLLLPPTPDTVPDRLSEAAFSSRRAC